MGQDRVPVECLRRSAKHHDAVDRGRKDRDRGRGDAGLEGKRQGGIVANGRSIRLNLPYIYRAGKQVSRGGVSSDQACALNGKYASLASLEYLDGV